MNINGHFAYSHRANSAQVISLTLGLLLAFRFVARAFCEFIYFIVFYFLLLIFSANGVCTKCIPMSSCKLQRQREGDRHTYIDFTSSGDKVQLMNTFTHTHTLIPCLGGSGWTGLCVLNTTNTNTNTY